MSKIITASKLNRLWKNGVLTIKSTLEGLINTERERIDDVEGNVSNKLSSYNDVMANAVEGYIPDALAVKEGFNQVNDSLATIKGSVTSVDDTVCKTSIYCKKFGDMVFINGTATPQKDLTEQTAVGILPEGFYISDGNWTGIRASSTSGASNYYCKIVNEKIYLHGNVDTIKNGTPILITGTYIVG